MSTSHTLNPLRKRRQQLGLSLRGMASLTGTCASNIYRAELGRRRLPLKLIHGLSEVTGETYKQILEDWNAWLGEADPERAERQAGLVSVAVTRAHSRQSTPTQPIQGAGGEHE